MEEDRRNAYTEVFEILKNMDRKLVMKIPIEIVKTIKDNRNIEYKVKIDKNDIFNKKNISKRALNILGWLQINYLSEKDEKMKLINKYIKNELKNNLWGGKLYGRM